MRLFVSVSRRRSPWILLGVWICVAAAGAPFPTDDSYEPNDVPPLAFDLRGHEGSWLSTHSGPAAQFDDDWYLVEVPPGRHQLILEIIGPVTAYMSAAVLDPGNNQLTEQYWSGSATNRIDVDVLTHGTCRVKIGGNNRGAAYDLRWSTPADDRYEPNNALAEAPDLPPRFWSYVYDDPDPMVQADEDWYRIEVPAGYPRVLVQCWFVHAEGDVDVSLHDAGGNQIAISQSTTDHEEIDATVAAPGTYYLRVYYGNTGNRYDLCWWPVSGDPAGDDAYEPNDAPLSAYDLAAYEGQWISTIAGDAIWLDMDLYAVETVAGDHSVRVECDVKDAGVTQGWITLYDDGGDWINTHEFSGQGTVEARFPVPGAGRYMVVVDARVSPEGTPIDYDLRWHADADDAWEDNDAFAAAVTRQWGPFPPTQEYFLGPGYQADDDWYECYGTPGTDLVIECLFEHADGDIDIALYDTNGGYVAESRSITDHERIEYAVPDGGGAPVSFRVNVFYGNAGNRYDLSYMTQVPDPIPGDDAYEPNDSLSVAFDLSGERGRWLNDLAGLATQLDNDWFRIEAAAGDAWIVVETSFADEFAADIVVYDRRGRAIPMSWSTSPPLHPARPVIVAPVPEPGSYFIRVSHNPPAGTYNLRWDVLPATLSAASWDPYEYNDSFSWACDLSLHEQAFLSELSAPGILRGEDWYRVAAGTGRRRLVVECFYDPAEGDVSIQLVDRHGVVVAVAEDLGGFRRFDVIIPAEDEYYLRVFGGADGQSYDLRWNDLAAFGPVCEPPRVAYFEDQQFIYGGTSSPGGEGGLLLRELLEDPDTAEVHPFTGTSAATFLAAIEDADILCIPSLRGADLAAGLSADARTAIRGFVEGGGGCLVFGDYDGRSARFVNDVFGTAVATGPDIWAGGYDRQPGALDTAWEFGSRRISQQYDEHPWRTGSLPGGSTAVYGFYELGTNHAAVAHLPMGAGNVVFLKWGFTASMTTYDGTYGEWSDVLTRALEQCRPCAPPATRISFFNRAAPPPVVEVGFATLPRIAYRIEYRENHAPGTIWTPFADPSIGVGSWIDESGFPGGIALVDDFGPATSGGPPVGGRRFYRIAAEVPADVALYTDVALTDPFYVEMMGAGLERLRHVTRDLSGSDPDTWTTALGGVHALVIPSLVGGDSAAGLPAEILEVLHQAIVEGRTLVLTGDPFGHAAALTTALVGTPIFTHDPAFGFPMILTPDLPIPALEGAPPEIAGNEMIHPWDTADVLAAGFSAYDDLAAFTGVAWIPLGAGRIVYLGWNWSDARPLGSFDGGWMEILDRATHP